MPYPETKVSWDEIQDGLYDAAVPDYNQTRSPLEFMQVTYGAWRPGVVMTKAYPAESTRNMNSDHEYALHAVRQSFMPHAIKDPEFEFEFPEEYTEAELVWIHNFAVATTVKGWKRPLIPLLMDPAPRAEPRRKYCAVQIESTKPGLSWSMESGDLLYALLNPEVRKWSKTKLKRVHDEWPEKLPVGPAAVRNSESAMYVYLHAQKYGYAQELGLTKEHMMALASIFLRVTYAPYVASFPSKAEPKRCIPIYIDDEEEVAGCTITRLVENMALTHGIMPRGRRISVFNLLAWPQDGKEVPTRLHALMVARKLTPYIASIREAWDHMNGVVEILWPKKTVAGIEKLPGLCVSAAIFDAVIEYNQRRDWSTPGAIRRMTGFHATQKNDGFHPAALSFGRTHPLYHEFKEALLPVADAAAMLSRCSELGPELFEALNPELLNAAGVAPRVRPLAAPSAPAAGSESAEGPDPEELFLLAPERAARARARNGQ